MFSRYTFDRSRLHRSHILPVVLPYCLGAAAYGLYVLQSPGDWLDQFGANAAGRFNGLRAPLHAIVAEVADRYLPAYGFHSVNRGLSHLKVLILLSYVVGLVGVVFTRKLRRRGGLPLILLWATFFVGMTFFHSKLEMYFVHILPWYAAMLAMSVSSWWQRSGTARVMVTLWVVAICILQVAVSLYRVVVLDTFHREYLPALRFLQARCSPEDPIMGDVTWAFGVGFDRVLGDATLGYYSGKTPDFIVLRSAPAEEAAAWYRSNRPNIYHHMRRRIEREFRLIYDYNGVRIWRRNAFADPPVQVPPPIGPDGQEVGFGMETPLGGIRGSTRVEPILRYNVSL